MGDTIHHNLKLMFVSLLKILNRALLQIIKLRQNIFVLLCHQVKLHPSLFNYVRATAKTMAALTAPTATVLYWLCNCTLQTHTNVENSQCKLCLVINKAQFLARDTAGNWSCNRVYSGPFSTFLPHAISFDNLSSLAVV